MSPKSSTTSSARSKNEVVLVLDDDAEPPLSVNDGAEAGASAGAGSTFIV